MSIDALWAEVKTYYGNAIERDNPDTWKFFGFMNKFGFVTDGPLTHPQIWKNRQNHKIYNSFKKTYEIIAKK